MRRAVSDLTLNKRIWRRRGLKVPAEQDKRARQWLNDGSCIRLRHELLNGELFYNVREAIIVIEAWRRHHNTVQPHPPLRNRLPAPEVFTPAMAAWSAAQTRPAPPTALPLLYTHPLN